jgi:prepilin-type N-terminal cleavage/methylation domain-containing protein
VTYHRGFTLIEILVVLVLLGMAAALAAPALRSVLPTHRGLSSLIPEAREIAAERGDTVYLRIAESGEWRIEDAKAAGSKPVATGRVDPFPGLPLALIVSPRGSCAFDPHSGKAAASIRLEPRTCKVQSS